MARDVLWDLGNEFQDTTVAWHNGEKRAGIEIVDANLSGQDLAKGGLLSRKQVRRKFERLLSHIPAGTVDADYMRATLKSRITVIDALSGVRVPPIDIYLRDTVGVNPSPVFYGELVKMQSAYQEAVKNVTGRPYNPEASKRLLEETRQSGEEYFDDCLDAERRFKQPFEDATGVVFNPMNNAQLVSRAAYWLAWTSYDQNGDRLLLNSNQRVSNRRRKGTADLVVGHEGAHKIANNKWAKAIANKEINPAYSTMAITDPSQSVNEPMATAIFKYIPGLEDKLTDHGRLILVREVFRNALMGNVHLWINGYPDHPGDIRKYLEEWLPGEVGSHFDAELIDRTSNLILKGYLGTYTDSHLFNSIAESLSVEQKLRVFREYLHKPMTHPRFIQVVEQVRRADFRGAVAQRPPEAGPLPNHTTIAFAAH